MDEKKTKVLQHANVWWIRHRISQGRRASKRAQNYYRDAGAALLRVKGDAEEAGISDDEFKAWLRRRLKDISTKDIAHYMQLGENLYKAQRRAAR